MDSGDFCDLHRHNLLVSTKGIKIIDWDNARVDIRLAELTKTMLCIHQETDLFLKAVDEISEKINHTDHPMNQDEKDLLSYVNDRFCQR